jgi:hypothetical protein
MTVRYISSDPFSRTSLYRRKVSMAKGLVVYRGPSAYDPSTTIRAVLVLKSSNRKTGNMAQLYILHDATPPHTAQRTGEDAAVCGDCPFRPALSGGCYVVTVQGPLSTWKATRHMPSAGAAVVARALFGRTLRLGAYGDPAALPLLTVQWLARLVKGRATGYTHGWRTRPDLKPFCMASVESPADAAHAQSQGWRTFRGRPASGAILPQEIDCPSEIVACEKCLLCKGSSSQARSITIPVHGFRTGRALTVVQ